MDWKRWIFYGNGAFLDGSLISVNMGPEFACIRGILIGDRNEAFLEIMVTGFVQSCTLEDGVYNVRNCGN